MFFKISSFALIGIEAMQIFVEVHISNGLPSLTVVGLPGKAVNESRQRVRAAIINSGFKFPLKKIIINLSPADIKKEGALYDLPIAVAILAAAGQVNPAGIELIEKSCFIGELSLNGLVQPVKGVISMSEHALKFQKKYFFLPLKNLKQAKLIEYPGNIGFKNLFDVMNAINNYQYLKKIIAYNKTEDLWAHEEKNSSKGAKDKYDFDFSEIKGQLKAKRAAEIAASGMHNLMLIGPPGAGKTMLAQRMVTLMPALTSSESIEVTKIYSLSSSFNDNLISARPFRSPHHTVSRASLTGGGLTPKPGEISLAHRGILFLDEFHQFPRNLIEDLRQPIENKKIIISRNNLYYRFPCSFMLVVATNPCYCGYYGDSRKKCICSSKEILNYWNSISGPIMDRIDMRIDVPAVKKEDMISNGESEASPDIKKRVENCHKIQKNRFKNNSFHYNSEAGFKYIDSWIVQNKDIKELLSKIIIKYNLTGRGITSLVKISRTIADMDNSENIKSHHLVEAVNYRINFNFYV